MASNINNQTERPTRRRALAVLATAIPAIALTDSANAAVLPSAEFLRCKEMHTAWLDLVIAEWPTGPDWPNDTSVYDAYEKRVEVALEEYCLALDELIALPPSKQKLSELLSLAVMESKSEHTASEERDFLSGERALVGAMKTFEALGEGGNA